MSPIEQFMIEFSLDNSVFLDFQHFHDEEVERQNLNKTPEVEYRYNNLANMMNGNNNRAFSSSFF